MLDGSDNVKSIITFLKDASTVRDLHDSTIDLSGPDVTSSGRQSVPVTADALEETVAEPGEAQEQGGSAEAVSA